MPYGTHCFRFHSSFTVNLVCQFSILLCVYSLHTTIVIIIIIMMQDNCLKLHTLRPPGILPRKSAIRYKLSTLRRKESVLPVSVAGDYPLACRHFLPTNLVLIIVPPSGEPNTGTRVASSSRPVSIMLFGIRRHT